MSFKQLLSGLNRLVIAVIPGLNFLYNPSFNRKAAVAIGMVFVTAPLVGYFRRPFVKRKFRKQLQAEMNEQEELMKESLDNLSLDLKDNDFEYLVIVRSPKNDVESDELFFKQKRLFDLNSQILDKVEQNSSYFEGISFLFIGSKGIYEGLEKNVSKQTNYFEHLEQPQSQGSQQDRIILVSRQADGSNSILMEWELDSDLKSILRQISKHKHKKFLESMSF